MVSGMVGMLKRQCCRAGCGQGAVATLTRSRFPDLDIPPHSRWRHFGVGDVDRTAALTARLDGGTAADSARAMIDLAVVSVLLDAGAGADWGFVEDGVRSPQHG